MKINFYINGNLVEPPENIRELVVVLNNDKENIEHQTYTNPWHMVRENATLNNQ
jgi:hypothetical protein